VLALLTIRTIQMKHTTGVATRAARHAWLRVQVGALLMQVCMNQIVADACGSGPVSGVKVLWRLQGRWQCDKSCSAARSM